MSKLEQVSETRSAAWLVAAGAYLVAVAGAVWVRKASGGAAGADLAGAIILSVPLFVTAMVVRHPAYPRWSLLAASGILAAGMVISVLIAPTSSDSLVGTWSYAWLYLALMGGTRASGPRWCHSPWVVVGASGVLSLIGVIARVL